MKLIADKGIRTLFIGGFVSNGCVQVACTEALKQGFDVVVLSDTHSTFVKNAGEVIKSWNTKMAGVGVRVIETAAEVRLQDSGGSD